MVAQEGESWDDAGGGDVESQFVFEDAELLDEFGETLSEVGAVVVQLFGCAGVFGRRRVGGGRFGERRS